MYEVSMATWQTNLEPSASCADRAVDHVGQARAQTLPLRLGDPEQGLLDVPLHESKLPRGRARDAEALQEQGPPLPRGEDLHDLLRPGVAEGLGADHRHHLLDPPVSRGLGE